MEQSRTWSSRAYIVVFFNIGVLTAARRPTVAIMQWRNEIETHTDNMLKTLVWHGSSRETSTKELKKYDVVSVSLSVIGLVIYVDVFKILTSYAVLESCFRKEISGFKRKGKIVKEKSPLHAIQWHRIIVSRRRFNVIRG